MKYSDVKGMSKPELKKKLIEVKDEVFQGKMKNSLGQLGNPLTIRFARRNVARIKMALSQKSEEKKQVEK